MKLKAIFAAMIITLPLCACSQSSTSPEQMPQSYTADIEFTDNGRQFSAKLTKQKGSFEYEFTAPESIKGLKLYKNAEGFSAELEKLKISDAPEKLSESSPAVMIAEALDMCSSGKGLSAEKQGNKTINKGVINGADLSVTFEKGSPTSMEIGGEIAVTFKNFNAE